MADGGVWVKVYPTEEPDPSEVEVFFSSFDDAYNFKLVSDRSMEPLTVENTDG